MTQSLLTDGDLSFLDENYKRVTERAAAAALRAGRSPDSVRLMAVTKTVSPLYINHMIRLGASLIGENKVQELQGKLEFLTEPCEKHIIGHLQSNKVRKIITTVDMIQSVDSVSLAKEISRCAQLNGVKAEILLEVNIGDEEAKTGLPTEILKETACEIAEMPAVLIRGLMCVPPICETEAGARGYFEKTRVLFEDMKGYLGDRADVDVLSMGMSSDYEAAILEGSSLVRVGSSLFGKRVY